MNDKCVVGVAQRVEHRVVAPGVEGSSPFIHPIYAISDCGDVLKPTGAMRISVRPNERNRPNKPNKLNKPKRPNKLHEPQIRNPQSAIGSAPVAQQDRAPDFESVGRPFESGRACQGSWGLHFLHSVPRCQE